MNYMALYGFKLQHFMISCDFIASTFGCSNPRCICQFSQDICMTGFRLAPTTQAQTAELHQFLTKGSAILGSKRGSFGALLLMVA